MKSSSTSFLSGLGVFGFDTQETLILSALVSEAPLVLIGRLGTGKTFLLNSLSEALGLDHRHYNASLIFLTIWWAFPYLIRCPARCDFWKPRQPARAEGPGTPASSAPPPWRTTARAGTGAGGANRTLHRSSALAMPDPGPGVPSRCRGLAVRTALLLLARPSCSRFKRNQKTTMASSQTP